VLSEHADEELTLSSLTSFALNSGVDDEMLDGVREKAVQRFFGTVLNRAKLRLPDGRKVRAFQNYTKFEQSKDGREVQRQIWKDIDHMNYRQMRSAAKERARHIQDSRASLQADVDYWNETVRPKFHARRIQLEF
jgi:poly-D-alanine transfer protein DltD